MALFNPPSFKRKEFKLLIDAKYVTKVSLSVTANIAIELSWLLQERAIVKAKSLSVLTKKIS